MVVCGDCRKLNLEYPTVVRPPNALHNISDLIHPLKLPTKKRVCLVSVSPATYPTSGVARHIAHTVQPLISAHAEQRRAPLDRSRGKAAVAESSANGNHVLD